MWSIFYWYGIKFSSLIYFVVYYFFLLNVIIFWHGWSCGFVFLFNAFKLFKVLQFYYTPKLILMLYRLQICLASPSQKKKTKKQLALRIRNILRLINVRRKTSTKSLIKKAKF